uniref:Uncharacterized protein n=1 Tax=Kalanchoe fedtschenkoi TaxID=63787 RepID=A0A7N0UU80_KALFE
MGVIAVFLCALPIFFIHWQYRGVTTIVCVMFDTISAMIMCAYLAHNEGARA